MQLYVSTLESCLDKSYVRDALHGRGGRITLWEMIYLRVWNWSRINIKWNRKISMLSILFMSTHTLDSYSVRFHVRSPRFKVRNMPGWKKSSWFGLKPKWTFLFLPKKLWFGGSALEALTYLTQPMSYFSLHSSWDSKKLVSLNESFTYKPLIHEQNS